MTRIGAGHSSARHTATQPHAADSREPARFRPPPTRRRIAHVLAPLAIALAVGGLLYASASETLTPATPIVVAPVVFNRAADAPPPDVDAAKEPSNGAALEQRQRNNVTVQAPGWLEADPYYVACTALADGVVAEMLVLEGQPVEAGQVVARLVDDDARIALNQAEADVARERAKLAMAQADVNAAQTDWDNPIERERDAAVAAGALAEAEAELVQLPALIDVEVAALQRQEEELNRARSAMKSGAVNPLELIVIEKGVEAQKATVESLRLGEAMLAARRDQLRAEHHAALRRFELRVEERRALENAFAVRAREIAEVRMAEARRDEAQLRLDRMTIRAPIDGYVQRRLKVPGDKVMLAMDDEHSSHLLHLYDPSSIQVRVDVPLADAANVFTGQQCEAIVEVLPDQTFAAEVTRITHEADLQKNTLQVKVRIVDPSPLLRPEMLTRVKFLPMTAGGGHLSARPGAGEPHARRESVLVPNSTLVRSDASNDATVWVVRERRGDRGVVQPTNVQILSVEDEWATVTGELFAGDLLAVEPAGLSPDQSVRITAQSKGGSQ